MTNKFCPFMSTMAFDQLWNEVFLEKFCVEDQCQVWDALNNRCGAQTSDIQIHQHNSHSHPRAHTCLGSKGLIGVDTYFYNTCGDFVQGNLISRSSVLINEFMFNSDSDGNGKVYGYDFMISDSSGKPPVLYTLEQQPSWEDPACKITWQQFIDWMDNYGDPQYDPWTLGNPCEGL